MREKGGYKEIIEAIEKLGKAHTVHMKVYGKDNEQRLTGKHETASYKVFKYGVADRGASIRIPRQVEIDQMGYFEDRRPAANMDPYIVTSMIARTTILGDTYGLNEKELNVMNESQMIDNDTKKELAQKIQQIAKLSEEVMNKLNQ